MVSKERLERQDLQETGRLGTVLKEKQESV